MNFGFEVVFEACLTRKRRKQSFEKQIGKIENNIFIFMENDVVFMLEGYI
jgi:hypothetical protein